MNDLRARILLDLAGNLERNSKRYSGAMNRMSKKGQRDMELLSRSADRAGKAIDGLGGRYTGMLAGAGAGYVALREVSKSGRLDKDLIRVRQTAGATKVMAGLLRQELHAMSEETGQSVDSLLAGFNNLIQSNMSWDKALLTIKATNSAMAVTGAQAEVLTSATTVAAKAFEFDLSKPQLAVELLDKMTVAGRLGNAELEDLSGIFARIGVNAKAAGLSFEDTLGFIEQLSFIEKQPERLATLADSTLRLFTNQKYLQKAAKATKVDFYEDGEKRSAFDVLADIATKFKTIKGGERRDKAIQAAFGEADLDTIKGLRALLSGDAIANARKMSETIKGSTGTIAKDLDDALSNSVDQVGRLKNALHEAADHFAQPVNDAVEGAVKHLLDERGLSGGEILAGGATATLAGLVALKGSGKLLKKIGSTGGGVAAGKALEEFAGVQPVYVVNMPGGGAFMPGGGMPLASRGATLRAGAATATTLTATGSKALALAPVLAPAVVAGLALTSGEIAKSLARTEASIKSTEDLLKLRSRQMVMGGGAMPGNFQVETIEKELVSRGYLDRELIARRYGGGALESGHGQQPPPMRAEMTVKVQAEKGTTAKTDGLRSSHDNFNLQAETEVGLASGGGW